MHRETIFSRINYSSLAKNSQTRNSYCFFLSVMPPKDLAPFSYISRQKTLSTIKYELIIELPLLCRLGLVVWLGSV